MADIRPLTLANLVPVWGLEKALEFGRRLAEQKPIWSRGSSRALTSLTAGEYPLIMGINLGSVLEVQAKDPTKRLQVKLVEPLPGAIWRGRRYLWRRPSTLMRVYYGWSSKFHPKLRKFWTKHGLGDGFGVDPRLLPGKVNTRKTDFHAGWDLHQNLDEWSKKIVEAYGFPVAEKGQ